MNGTKADRSAGRIIVVSGPSGSGKTTVCRRLLEAPGVTASVSATTRPPRAGERDGVDYRFLSRDEFLRRVGRGEFAEHAEYDGNLYGTPKQPVDEALAEGRTVLLEIDVQGAEQLRGVYPDATYVFLEAPDREAALARLEHRNTESAEARRRRLAAAEREMARKNLFDHVVVNDDLDEAVTEVRRLIAEVRTDL